MSDEEDFLEELIAESTKQDPDFPKLLKAAEQRRREARARGEDPNAEPEEDDAEDSKKRPATPQTKA